MAVSYAKRRAALVALLLAVMVWPVAHRGLVEVYGVSPWKLFGWAMYCRPKPESVTRLGLPDGEEVRWMRARDLSDGVREALEAYHARWRVLGRLVEPAQVAERFFAGGAGHREVVVESIAMELEGGRVVRRVERHRFTSQGAEAPASVVRRVTYER